MNDRDRDMKEADALIREHGQILSDLEEQDPHGVGDDRESGQKLDALEVKIDRLLGIGRPLRCKPYPPYPKSTGCWG